MSVVRSFFSQIKMRLFKIVLQDTINGLKILKPAGNLSMQPASEFQAH